MSLGSTKVSAFDGGSHGGIHAKSIGSIRSCSGCSHHRVASAAAGIRLHCCRSARAGRIVIVVPAPRGQQWVSNARAGECEQGRGAGGKDGSDRANGIFCSRGGGEAFGGAEKTDSHCRRPVAMHWSQRPLSNCLRCPARRFDRARVHHADRPYRRDGGWSFEGHLDRDLRRHRSCSSAGPSAT
jgi:hypothetical protein